MYCFMLKGVSWKHELIVFGESGIVLVNLSRIGEGGAPKKWSSWLETRNHLNICLDPLKWRAEGGFHMAGRRTYRTLAANQRYDKQPQIHVNYIQ
jgi:hypothetical protein